MEPKGKKILARAGAVLFALLLWQLAAMWVDSKILLVTPIAVLKRMATIWQVENFWKTIGFTLWHIAAGFALGFVLGVILAALAGRLPWIETLLWPFMITVKSVPVASFVVICLIWLSAQNLSIFISFLIVLPIVYSNILTGLKSRNREMVEMARVFRVPFFRMLKYVTLPELRPYVESACASALGLAWKAGVAAEVIGAPNGSIGKQLYYAKIYLDTDDLLCWTVIIVIVSVLFEKAFMALLRLFYRRLERG
jgi:NitT/TauT family transport system permease protein